MSYYTFSHESWTTLVGHAGIGPVEDDLYVEINYHEWSEAHPYGSTVAHEPMSEYEIVATRLNGVDVSMDFLVAGYGEETATRAIDEAIETAINDYYK